ncbi:MAG: stage II sporulation protein P, partial [Lachnospiraceae bacterium]|nr:stage II sporulation protein P [Lachnospiraceae bacterium]
LMFRIYLKNYRYNQHFRERCMLIELGTDQNTVQEAYNAMEPLADILNTVLCQ